MAKSGKHIIKSSSRHSRSMEQAFDEWMRRYIKNPKKFQVEFKAVTQFQKQSRKKGKTTSYGRDCAGYLRALMLRDI